MKKLDNYEKQIRNPAEFRERFDTQSKSARAVASKLGATRKAIAELAQHQAYHHTVYRLLKHPEVREAIRSGNFPESVRLPAWKSREGIQYGEAHLRTSPRSLKAVFRAKDRETDNPFSDLPQLPPIALASIFMELTPFVVSPVAYAKERIAFRSAPGSTARRIPKNATDREIDAAARTSLDNSSRAHSLIKLLKEHEKTLLRRAPSQQ